ncbi:MAG: hypothetical protein ACFHU9_02220 [Fluviicola sp.]
MKRKLRTYLALALLVTLTFQNGAYELVHLLGHHKAKHETEHSCESTHVENASTTDHQIVFNTLHHCDGCDVLIAMDDQNLVSVGSADLSLKVITADHYENLTSQYKHKRSIRNLGRAPPLLNLVSILLRALTGLSVICSHESQQKHGLPSPGGP